MSDYSITSPEILIKSKADSLGKMLVDFSVPELVVIAAKSEIGKLAQMTDASLADWAFSPLHIGKVGKKHVGLVPLVVGAPATAFLVENLIACGAKTILLSTALGAFQPKMKPGDFVIPSRVIIGEGTSKYYFPRKRVARPSPEIVEVLKEACRAVGVKPYVGSIWNTDAIYREMRSQVEKLQSQGVLGVEMETSAMCTVADFRGARAGSLLRVSDSLARFRWEPYFWKEEYLERAQSSPLIVIEALKLLTDQKDQSCWR